MKIAGILLIIFSCAGLGVSKSHEMGQRFKLLKEWHRLILLLMQEITYHTTLPDACSKVSRRTGIPYSEFLDGLSKRLISCEGEAFHQMFGEEVEKHMGNCSLSKEDLAQIKMLGEMMQDADRTMQKQILERYSKELQLTIDELRQQLPGKQKLCRSLGILGGVFLGIILL